MQLDPSNSPRSQDQGPGPSPAATRRRRLWALAWLGLWLTMLLESGALLHQGSKWGILLAFVLISIDGLIGLLVSLRWIFDRWGIQLVVPRSIRRRVAKSTLQDQAALPPPTTQNQTITTSVMSTTTGEALPASVPLAESTPTFPSNTVSVTQETNGSPTAITDESPGAVDDPAYAGKNSPPPFQRAAILAQQKDFRRRSPRPVDSRHGGYLLDQSGTDRLFLLAGSVLGGRHDQPGLMREDDVAFYADPATTNTIVAAVADGVGSARQSHLVSALAVRIAVNALASWLAAPNKHGVLSGWEQTASDLVRTVDDSLVEELLKPAHLDLIGTSRLVEEDYMQRPGRPAATLAVMVVDEAPEGFFASWLTVGDCDVVVSDFVNDEVRWLTDRAYRRGPRTEAVPSHRKTTRCGQDFLADGEAVMAMTDGMAELLSGGEGHSLKQALVAAQKRESALVDLLTALDARQHGNYDDRSLVAIGPISRR